MSIAAIPVSTWRIVLSTGHFTHELPKDRPCHAGRSPESDRTRKPPLILTTVMKIVSTGSIRGRRAGPRLLLIDLRPANDAGGWLALHDRESPLTSIGLFLTPHPFLFPCEVQADTAEIEHTGRKTLGPAPGQPRIGCPSEWLKSANSPSVGERLTAVADNEFRVPMSRRDFQNIALARFNQ